MGIIFDWCIALGDCSKTIIPEENLDYPNGRIELHLEILNYDFCDFMIDYDVTLLPFLAPVHCT
jgi:hypothetical protein